MSHMQWRVTGGTTAVDVGSLLQAEDGIRYYKVTGVQTCALPIYALGRNKGFGLLFGHAPPSVKGVCSYCQVGRPFSSAHAALASRLTGLCGVRTSCVTKEAAHSDRNVFILSNRMRNAMTRSVSQNSLNTIFRNFKLFRDFGHAHTIIEVIDNRVDWHPRTAQHRGTALHSRIDLDQRAFRPVDVFFRSHDGLPDTIIPSSRPKTPEADILADAGRRPPRHHVSKMIGPTCRGATCQTRAGIIANQRKIRSSGPGNEWQGHWPIVRPDRKSTRLNSSHLVISYAV